MANTPGNVILLTNRGEDDTLARDLYSRWESEQTDDAKYGRGKIGTIQQLTGPLSIEVGTSLPGD